jgi:hypothetical protein
MYTFLFFKIETIKLYNINHSKFEVRKLDREVIMKMSNFKKILKNVFIFKKIKK